MSTVSQATMSGSLDTRLCWPCASSGNEKPARKLLNAGADLTVCDGGGYTALHHAAWWWHSWTRRVWQQCCALVDASADVNARDKVSETPLHKATAHGTTGTVTVLLERGADPRMPSATGATPLHYAAKRRQMHIGRLLIQMGVDVNAVDNEGRTPLRLLVSESIVTKRDASLVTEFTTLLLEEGAMLPKDDGTYGARLATCAVLRNNATFIERYLSSGGTINADEASDAMQLALENGCTDILKLLIARLRDDAVIYAPFVKAINESRCEILKMLLDAGVNVNLKDIQGHTIAHCAATANNVALLELYW